MDFSSLQPIDVAVTLSVIWIGLGVIGLAFVRAPRFITRLVFPAGAVVSLALAATGVWAIGAAASAAILPAGLPDLPFHVRVAALSGFRLLPLGGGSFGIS
jgi:hydrogenase-4 component B